MFSVDSFLLVLWRRFVHQKYPYFACLGFGGVSIWGCPTFGNFAPIFRAHGRRPVHAVHFLPSQSKCIKIRLLWTDGLDGRAKNNIDYP